MLQLLANGKRLLDLESEEPTTLRPPLGRNEAGAAAADSKLTRDRLTIFFIISCKSYFNLSFTKGLFFFCKSVKGKRPRHELYESSTYVRVSIDIGQVAHEV